ncbi:type I-F CRISPR-associated endoribonuclease Cas6/Csy4 [Ferrimonas senticii]|uniref:type I-F CRISPR-associated endoribonuclease Cas6/Csy4 n=1 Tax=Ferrimonas senticii TaxID=394566 RepID=UPI000487AC83|nr:type I-F CRISPR-associated endoribonuclease Cas6/Csy4 [Ferrimonas senticii]
MKQRYFFAIRYLPVDVDACLLAGRCISVLHGFLCRHQVAGGIGVSFPDWTEASLGNSIAFVCANKALLEHFSKQNYFDIMASDQLFECTEIHPVSRSCPEVRFKRNQSIAKCFPGEKRRRLERAKRRAEDRGEVFQPVVDVIERRIDPFHSVLMHSKSTGQQFLLHIQKELNLCERSDSYGQYGLGTNQQYLGTVPEFRDCKTNFFG